MPSERGAPPWYRWHWEAFLKAVRGWSFDERALYRELLDIQWQEGSIPKNDEAARVMTGCSPQQWAAAWPVVAPKFPITHGRRQNFKMAMERDRAMMFFEQASAAGRKSAAMKKQRKENQPLSQGALEVGSTDLDLRFRSRGESKKDAQGSLTSVGVKVVATKTARATRSPAARLPQDFNLDLERIAYAEKQGLDAARTMENFRDYWTAKDGPNARKLDWDATWRMWCRKEADSPRKGSKTVRRAKTVAELEAEEAQKNAKQ